MSISAPRIVRPATPYVLPVLRPAVLALALPALFSGTPPLLALAFVGVAGLGLWMLAFALGLGDRSRARAVRPFAAAVSLVDGLALLTAAGFILGVLIKGSTLAAVTTPAGFLAVVVFLILGRVHRKMRRRARRIRRR